MPPPAPVGPARYQEIRRATEALRLPLSAEDCAVQSMPDASPVKWHLAHTSWFFETFVLEPAVRGYSRFHPGFRFLFNSYYQSVGEQWARSQRGLLSRPTLDAVVEYRAHVDRHMTDLLADPVRGREVAGVVELGLHHEQQHQELILTDVKHLLAMNPLRPAYHAGIAAPRAEEKPISWHGFGEGVRSIGHAGTGFAFDNEGPRHRVFLEAFELAHRPATNAEFLAFIGDAGYERPELWLSDGWIARQRQGWRAPLYWEDHAGGFRVATLAGLQPLDPSEPVCHLSFYEADAFARWFGARLPTEAEWEVAAEAAPIAGNFAEDRVLHPRPADASAAAALPVQLFGDVWEWTRSAYEPYPGYRPPDGALGEYNGKFMCNQFVLRGGSCATPRSHIRPSYRNFFPPDARWQFSGVRLAREAS
jgi:ergothioneine biosynthesis protein EgtB